MSKWIKHFQEYGAVKMEILKKEPDLLVIDVYGIHEYGLENDDSNWAKRWLLPHVKGYDGRSVVRVDMSDRHDDVPFTTKDGHVYPRTEHCVYTFAFSPIGH